MTSKKLKGRGGPNRGQGRKPSGKPPKKQIPAKVHPEAHAIINEAHDKTGHSKASILEWWIGKLDVKKIPKDF